MEEAQDLEVSMGGAESNLDDTVGIRLKRHKHGD